MCFNRVLGPGVIGIGFLIKNSSILTRFHQFSTIFYISFPQGPRGPRGGQKPVFSIILMGFWVPGLPESDSPKKMVQIRTLDGQKSFVFLCFCPWGQKRIFNHCRNLNRYSGLSSWPPRGPGGGSKIWFFHCF